MKQSTLEPGLVQTLRVYVILAALAGPLSWHFFAPMLGIQVGLDQFIRPTLPVFVFLVIYTTFPWWQRRMGRAFLPIALILLATQAVAANYLTLQWRVPSSSRELAALLFMLRLLITFQILVLL